MKTIITNSIKTNRFIGKTIFDLIENPTEEEKIQNEITQRSRVYESLTKLSGRTLYINYSFSENDLIVEDRILLTIPENNNEIEIKDFIINEINTKLNS
jgi:hypothetical protein